MIVTMVGCPESIQFKMFQNTTMKDGEVDVPKVPQHDVLHVLV